MNTEHPKQLNFEEWLEKHLVRLDSSCSIEDLQDAFNDARRGLAGPPELVWDKVNGVLKSHISLINVHYHLFEDGFLQIDGCYNPQLPSVEKIKCDSIVDGKRQAQEHFESQWWSMSNPEQKDGK